MRVSNLALTDYRSYKKVVVEFPAGTVVLLGPNGRGKTNMVESIAYLSTFSSHRSHSIGNLVRVAREGQTQPGGAVIRARVEAGGRTHSIDLEIARGRPNRARLNRAKVAPRDVLGTLRTVVFAPEDLGLLRGGPEERRTFLDQIVLKLKPHHLSTLQNFGRVSRQRAAQLKTMMRADPAFGAEMMAIWDDQLAELSATIAVHRLAVVEALQPLVRQAYRDLTRGDREAEIEYSSNVEVEADLGDFRVEDGRMTGDPSAAIGVLRQAYLEQMDSRRGQEMARGINLVGAHRDDLLVTLDRLPVRGFASHGELWSSALMLRLAEMELLKLDGDYPVLILDDVFAELDVSRRDGLLRCMDRAEQVFITAAAETDIPSEIEARTLLVSRDDQGLSQVTDSE